MNTQQAVPEPATPLRDAVTCPGLDPSVRWDDPATLRGEIYVADHLVAHAAEVARVHGTPSTHVAVRLLWQRFVDVRSAIRDAYGILKARLENGQDPSPAEDWLLENSHVVEDQIREVQEDLPRGYLLELPRLATGAMRGSPRVYALCLDYLRHTDGRLDLATLSAYVESYQSIHTLTIGELWAVPIMLRLGLLLGVSTLAASEASAKNRSRADAWADRLLAVQKSTLELGARLAELEKSSLPIDAEFLVQLSRRLREHDDSALSVAVDWVATRSLELGSTPAELARMQHLRQAADQVSVGNAVTSMRAVAAFDWNEFFERTSAVEALLGRDPAGAYTPTTEAARDRYRHAVESIARRSPGDECSVARTALELARASHDARPEDAARAHVGYYLVDAGRPELERRVGFHPPLRQLGTRAVLARPSAFYFGTLGAFTAIACALVVALASPTLPFGVPLLAFATVALLPASEISLTLANALAMALVKPRLLGRLALKDGVPAELRTLVAIPCLLDNPRTLAQLLEELEVRSLANGDRHLHFALLTDFCDADTAECEGDSELLRAAMAGIAELNERYTEQEHRYFLLHRRRLHNPSEDCFMGWERKRGKLMELNRLLRGAPDTSFSVVTAPLSLLRSIRFVITLDADTELPRDVARKLVGTLAHPLNQPQFDVKRQRVVRGYGVAQPRVGALPLSSRRSRFAAIAAGPPGIDPYTTAVSDVYQDVFGEGSYVGKGIYDVDAFSAALAGRTPENLLLSHDLFEGLFARCALVTDVELFDEQPAAHEVQARRAHRWIRGDWQLLPWLAPHVPAADGGTRARDLRWLDAWKLLDNLRRSLLAPALVILSVAGWSSGGALSAIASGVLACVLATPVVARLLLDSVRESRRTARPVLGTLGGELGANSLQVLLNSVFLLDHSLVALDAIARTLFRLFVSKRHLLEWTTMRQSARRLERGRRVATRTWLGSALALTAGVLLAAFRPDALPFALPVLLLWSAAPLVADWSGRPSREARPGDPLSSSDRRFLRCIARKTWRFFAHFVTEKDHFLPPDNYQEDPRGVVAHRTSPTNIGLYLLSALAAHDFGFITLRELLERTSQTLDTLERLPRREGHILNWFDTQTLKPLEPQYVSTVDSGNLAAYLWTLRAACSELLQERVLTPKAVDSVLDALRLALTSAASSNAETVGAGARGLAELERELGERRAELGGDVIELLGFLREIEASVASQRHAPWVGSADSDVAYWLNCAQSTAAAWQRDVLALVPFVTWLDRAPTVAEGTPHAKLWQKLAAELREAETLAALLRKLPGALARCEKLARHLHEDPAAYAGTAPELADYLSSLREALQRSLDACRDAHDKLEEVGTRSSALADGMNFRFLFDEGRKLFVTGYNVSNARRDASHYDLLASEARLASLISVAKGDAPQEHWFRLARPRTRVSPGCALLSWSGSMFEYLMPLLVTRSYPHTLLDETARVAVARQRRYGAERGVPWGISESAYNVMDLEMTYQYRAFGVPALGLKPGLGEDLVVAPYATALAALVNASWAVKNLRALSREGLDGAFGYYEAIDYSPSRVPPGKRGVVVKSFMAHHHGMTLVALDNLLHELVMQTRFHADPRIKASELLLEERIPTRSPLLTVPVAALSTQPRQTLELEVVEHVWPTPGDPPRLHLLGHGSISTLVSASGTGALTWNGLDVNRFREDPVHDAGGIYVYVRNLSRHELWSAGLQPTQTPPDDYSAAFSIDRVELRRRDGELETVTEIVPSPEHAAEVRRITVTNHGSDRARVNLTTYTEVVLAPRRSDLAHRAFSSLFIETEALPQYGALLARRRPRSSGEQELWLVQVLAPEHEGFGELEFDSSRAEFVGRGCTLERPAAMAPAASLGQRVGTVLDPALVLRRGTSLEPGSKASIALTTALATSREEAVRLAEIYAAPHSILRAFELGWADARVELRHLGITAAQSHRFQRLLSAILMPRPELRAKLAPNSVRGQGRQALWARGISGDLPLLILRMDSPEFAELCRELLLAHEFWRVNGILVDFVILNEEPSGYMQPLHEAALDLIRSSYADGHVDQPGGVFLRRADQLSDTDRTLLLAAARVVLAASSGSLARQLARASARKRAVPEVFSSAARPSTPSPRVAPPRPPLLFDNGFGGFREGGDEYTLVLGQGLHTPAPWCNVLANPEFGSIVSESGASFTWAKNSQRNRLTPWSGDAVCDPSGELVYLRDDDDGSCWSATPAPAGDDEYFVVSHGQGYSRFEHDRGGLAHVLTLFVCASAPVKIFRLRLENRGPKTRRLSLFGVVEWVLGSSREADRLSVVTDWDPDARALLASNPGCTFPDAVAFFCATEMVRSITGNRVEFFGMPGRRERPAALGRTWLSGRTGAGLDPCGALHVPVKLTPGQTLEVSFVLGEAESRESARELALSYQSPRSIARAFEEVRESWRRVLRTVEIKTPDPALDLLVNRWLLYQTLGCRLWARSGFYQSSGAFGFRDQIQDVLALLHARPDLAREHLLRAAARQFVEGDVQHWWHPESGDGVRTHCSDDMLWLPFATTEYVRATGDRSVLDVQVPFLSERVLGPEQDDLYSAPAVAPQAASLYEHCTRALDAGATTGPHGLPKISGGDWNDGMNRVGRGGDGESVWLAWFSLRTLRDFAELAAARGDGPRVALCAERSAQLTRAVELNAWDGSWYRRAYFDDGTPLGTSTADECKIDAIAQSWATLAGTGDPLRAREALRQSEQLLIREDSRLMLLLTPPFERPSHDPGYIASYPAGIRENGGQYTHGVLWTAKALAACGEGDRAARLLSLLNPILHATNREGVLRYKVEPYVVAADVYAAPSHFGRGGWTWYTGSAGWMYRVIVEDLLGLRREGRDQLCLTPCLPRDWPGLELTYRYGSESELHVVVENVRATATDVWRVELEGRVLEDGRIPLLDDGARHELRVFLGADLHSSNASEPLPSSEERDAVDEASWESFPASDPPALSPGSH